MKKLLSILLILVLLVACGTDSKPNDDTSSDQDFKVILLIPGTLGDKSFFDAANKGMEKLSQTEGFETRVIEMTADETKWEPALLDAIDGDWDLIVSGNAASDLMNSLASDHPDKHFLNFDNSGTEAAENVYSVTYATNEGSFLAGAFAALVTGNDELELTNPEKVIGFLGGMDIPGINDFLVGYIQGALHADPDVKIITTYAGSFTDPAKGKELSLSIYDSGADIAFNVAGQTGLGLIDAAFEADKYAIGVDSDQAMLYKETDPDKADNVLTSVVKQINQVIVDSAKKAKDGTLTYGVHELLGLEASAVALADNEYYQVVPQSIRDQIDTIRQEIIDGKIEVKSGFAMTTQEVADYIDSVKP